MLRVQPSSAKATYQQLAEEFQVYGPYSAGRIDKLFQALLKGNIQNIEIAKNDEETEVTIELKKSKYKRLETTTLHLPQKIRFAIKDYGIEFSEDGQDAPYEERNRCCGILKDRLTWWELEVNSSACKFELIMPRWVGLFTPSCCGGTPNVRRIDAEQFIQMVSQSQSN